MAKVKQLTVQLENRPGTLAHMAKVFADAPRWLGGSGRLCLRSRLHLALCPALLQQPRPFPPGAGIGQAILDRHVHNHDQRNRKFRTFFFILPAFEQAARYREQHVDSLEVTKGEAPVKTLIAILALILLVVPCGAVAQQSPEVLTNDKVISLAQASLGDSLIISKIKASGCNFDVSTAALLSLKKAGVSDPVIEAMIQASAPAANALVPSALPNANDPQSPHDAGIYSYDG